MLKLYSSSISLQLGFPQPVAGPPTARWATRRDADHARADDARLEEPCTSNGFTVPEFWAKTPPKANHGETIHVRFVELEELDMQAKGICWALMCGMLGSSINNKNKSTVKSVNSLVRSSNNFYVPRWLEGALFLAMQGRGSQTSTSSQRIGGRAFVS